MATFISVADEGGYHMININMDLVTMFKKQDDHTVKFWLVNDGFVISKITEQEVRRKIKEAQS